MSMLSGVEKAKRKAARAAVDEFVKDGMNVGVGSGSTVVYAVERLVELVKEESYKLVCVPTSFQARQLIVEGGLVLGDLETVPVLDVAIDGADEVDQELNLIKGGGGCQTQEKIVASCAEQFVVIADYRKKSENLGVQWTKGVPLEVVPMAYKPVQLKLENDFGATATLRMAQSKAGPCVTDNGNLIIDAHFGPIDDAKVLEDKLNGIPGIVCTGLFVDMAIKAFFGEEDGSVTMRRWEK
mmetsp:Transcript_9585/g.16832  ORF Transcript_9585/g.16832 Transcript_9585/m.16832 type:complete len:240 (+) Transcript_9585:49-768(+)